MPEDGRHPRVPWWRRWFGQRSERAAAKHLRHLGYRIVTANARSRQGEIDIVALDGECIVFVEVRSTSNDSSEQPAMSVDLAKQRRISGAALRFLQQHRLLGRAARFDVLAISWPASASKPEIVHYRNAFEATGQLQMFN